MSSTTITCVVIGIVVIAAVLIASLLRKRRNDQAVQPVSREEQDELNAKARAHYKAGETIRREILFDGRPSHAPIDGDPED
jgi:hypothetical protein